MKFFEGSLASFVAMVALRSQALFKGGYVACSRLEGQRLGRLLFHFLYGLIFGANWRAMDVFFYESKLDTVPLPIPTRFWGLFRILPFLLLLLLHLLRVGVTGVEMLDVCNTIVFSTRKRSFVR